MLKLMVVQNYLEEDEKIFWKDQILEGFHFHNTINIITEILETVISIINNLNKIVFKDKGLFELTFVIQYKNQKPLYILSNKAIPNELICLEDLLIKDNSGKINPKEEKKLIKLILLYLNQLLYFSQIRDSEYFENELNLSFEDEINLDIESLNEKYGLSDVIFSTKKNEEINNKIKFEDQYKRKKSEYVSQPHPLESSFTGTKSYISKGEIKK